MGQQRELTVIRYVAVDTVEQVLPSSTVLNLVNWELHQNIVSLQRRKTRLAKVSLDSAEDNAEGGLEVCELSYLENVHKFTKISRRI